MIYFGGIVCEYMRSHSHLYDKSKDVFCRTVCRIVLSFLRLSDSLYFLENVCKRDDEICVACESIVVIVIEKKPALVQNTDDFPLGENEIWYDVHNNSVDLVYNYELLENE